MPWLSRDSASEETPAHHQLVHGPRESCLSDPASEVITDGLPYVDAQVIAIDVDARVVAVLLDQPGTRASR